MTLFANFNRSIRFGRRRQKSSRPGGTADGWAQPSPAPKSPEKGPRRFMVVRSSSQKTLVDECGTTATKAADAVDSSLNSRETSTTLVGHDTDVNSSFASTVDAAPIASLCLTRLAEPASTAAVASLSRDPLPDMDYASLEVSPIPLLVASGGHEMKSSSSFSSNLTDYTHVDDGLNDWGLPKVLLPEGQDTQDEFLYQEDYEASVNFDDTFVTGVDYVDEPLTALTASNAPVVSTFVELPQPSETSLQLVRAQKTLTLVYTAILLQKAGVVPPRYAKKPLKHRKSLFELQQESQNQQAADVMPFVSPFAAWM